MTEANRPGGESVASEATATAAGTAYTGTTEAKPRKPRRRGWSLDTFPAIRRRLARVLTDLQNDPTTDVTRSRALIYGLGIVGQLLRDEQNMDIERRVQALEERLSNDSD